MTDVIDTYVFRSLITNPDIGMTAAATFYQSVLCFAIIMIVNTVVKKNSFPVKANVFDRTNS